MAEQDERDANTTPDGIEEILGMAAAEPRFAAALLKDRDRTVEASGVALSPSERRMLDTVGPSALERMVAGVGQTLPEEDRRFFLGRAGAVLVALVGGGMAAASSGCRKRRGEQPIEVTGIRPQEVPPPTPDAKPAPDAKSAPDAGAQTAPHAPTPTPTPTPQKPHRPLTRGIRPDRPRPQTKGIRPDRPRPLTRGIRPDRDMINPFDDDKKD
jgi:hypothetical protein